MNPKLTTSNRVNYQYKYFTFMSMLYCTLLIVSVLLPYKIINLFGMTVPGGIFIFPLTYLFGGAIAEVYGRTAAVQTIWASILCLAIFNFIVAVIIRIPSAPNVPNQEAFMQAFGYGFRLTIGCIVGLLCSDLTNVYRITRLRAIFKGRYFWQRCLWTTTLSEAIFNVVCYSITYLGVISNNTLYHLMIYSWLLKITYSFIMLFPLLYLMRYLKKAEGIDIYDVKNINQFNIEEAVVKLFKNSVRLETVG